MQITVGDTIHFCLMSSCMPWSKGTAEIATICRLTAAPADGLEPDTEAWGTGEVSKAKYVIAELLGLVFLPRI